MVAELIAFALGNFTLTFFILGLIAAAIAVARQPDGFTRANVAEALLAYFILFSIGFSYFYNFVFHVFFGELAASYIGWADSPFQAEVGYAVSASPRSACSPSRATAWCGSPRSSGRRCPWGAAIGHIRDIIATGNIAPGNAGVMLYSDILLPFVGFALLWFKRSTANRAASRRGLHSTKTPHKTTIRREILNPHSSLFRG